jgi:hypothetical protein
LLKTDDRLGDQQALLDATHAFGLFSAQYGHRIAAAAFAYAGVPMSLSPQAATAHPPALVQATGTVASRPSAASAHLEEATRLDADGTGRRGSRCTRCRPRRG